MSDFRRFFFDDGASRKRWQVQVKGKAQLVKYGRLTGSLREAKKTFKTPVEAAEDTARLIASKTRGGYIEVNPSRLEIVPLEGNKGATDNQIDSLEKRLGCLLPDEYRSFLRERNGGRPNPDCVAVPGVEGIADVGVGTLLHLNPSQPKVDELSYEIERLAKILPKGHLPIAGSSDVFTLSLRPQTFGCVFWWFHETEDLDDEGNFLESAGYLLAGSFDEFLTRIALLFGDDEQVEENTVPASAKSEADKKPKASVKRLFRLFSHDHTPRKIKEIEQVVGELGDLSGIQDGEWPFRNITSVRLLRCLLKAGLNPEVTDREKNSLLYQCASSVPCINLLLKHGVDLERRSGPEDETALMRAMFLQSMPAVKRLIDVGANPTIRLRWYISLNLESNQKLREMVEEARVQWKRKKTGKKKAKRKGASN